jgi:hypothetical protein
VVSFTPRPLYLQGKIRRYPLDRRLGGPQNRSGRGGEEKVINVMWQKNAHMKYLYSKFESTFIVLLKVHVLICFLDVLTVANIQRNLNDIKVINPLILYYLLTRIVVLGA